MMSPFSMWLIMCGEFMKNPPTFGRTAPPPVDVPKPPVPTFGPYPSIFTADDADFKL